jgi:hypothetical protein
MVAKDIATRWEWPLRRFAWLEVAWGAFALANLVAMWLVPTWETVPFHFIWVSLTLVYGFRVWNLISLVPRSWLEGGRWLALGGSRGGTGSGPLGEARHRHSPRDVTADRSIAVRSRRFVKHAGTRLFHKPPGGRRAVAETLT